MRYLDVIRRGKRNGARPTDRVDQFDSGETPWMSRLSQPSCIMTFFSSQAEEFPKYSRLGLFGYSATW